MPTNKIYLSSKTNWIEDDGTNTRLFVDSANVLTIHNSTGDITFGDTPGTGSINAYVALLTAAFGITSNGAITINGTTTYLKLPVLTTTQRDALTPAKGQTVYNDSTKKLDFYDGGAWREVTST